MKGVLMKRVLAVILLCLFVVASVSAGPQAKKTEKAKDPVCGMMVDKDPALSVNYKGEVYYFCLKADMDKFKENPEKYVKKK
jgi:YHS domain-containing protein